MIFTQTSLFHPVLLWGSRRGGGRNNNQQLPSVKAWEAPDTMQGTSQTLVFPKKIRKPLAGSPESLNSRGAGRVCLNPNTSGRRNYSFILAAAQGVRAAPPGKQVPPHSPTKGPGASAQHPSLLLCSELV